MMIMPPVLIVSRAGPIRGSTRRSDREVTADMVAIFKRSGTARSSAWWRAD